MNWRGIYLLLMVTLLLGVTAFAATSAAIANGVEEDYSLRITKYASPVDGTEFDFTCESESGETCLITETFVLSHAQSIEPLWVIGGWDTVTITERLSQAHIDAGWRIYAIECPQTFSPAAVAEAQVANGPLFQPLIQIEDGITGTLVLPVDYYTHYSPYDCEFYNAIPSTITIRKVETPPVGTDYDFLMITATVPKVEESFEGGDIAAAAVNESWVTTSTFTLDDANPDDGDAITQTAVFTGLFPGSYSFLELNNERLQSIACTANGAPVSYEAAILDHQLAIVNGIAYSYTWGSSAFQSGCGTYLHLDSGGEYRALYEFGLASLPSGFTQVRFLFDLESYAAILPLTVEVYGYAGNGTIELDDFDAGSLLTSVAISGTESFAVDVTDFITGLLAASETHAGFNFRLLAPQSEQFEYLSVNVLCAPYLQFRNADGIAVALEGEQDVQCTFTNVASGGRVVVDKVVGNPAPGLDAVSFQFTLTDGIAPANFSLAAADAPYISGLLAPGVYTLTEVVPTGWAAPTFQCSDGASSYPAAGIAIVPGRTVTCTVTNFALGGPIVVDKVVSNPAPGLDAVPFPFTLTNGITPTNFSLSAVATPYNSGFLTPGTYTLSEVVPTGWATPTYQCSDGTATHPAAAIPIVPGRAVTCTVTNFALGGPIVVDKVVNEPIPGLDEVPFQFALTDGVTPTFFSLSALDSPYTSGLLTPGVYTLTEEVPLEWATPTYLCSDGAATYPAAGISIVPGRAVTCTVTNQLVPLALELVKTVRVYDGTPTCGANGALTVTPNTVVEFCYTITNTSAITLGLHSLDDSVLGDIFADVSYELGPDSSIDTVALGLVVTQTVEVSVTNVATWTASLIFDAPTPSGAAPAQGPVVTRSVTALALATVTVVEEPTGLPEIDQPVGDRRLFVPTLQR